MTQDSRNRLNACDHMTIKPQHFFVKPPLTPATTPQQTTVFQFIHFDEKKKSILGGWKHQLNEDIKTVFNISDLATLVCVSWTGSVLFCNLPAVPTLHTEQWHYFQMLWPLVCQCLNNALINSMLSWCWDRTVDESELETFLVKIKITTAAPHIWITQLHPLFHLLHH